MSIQGLPNEILHHILFLNDLKTLFILERVSTAFQKLVNDKVFWTRICSPIFGYLCIMDPSAKGPIESELPKQMYLRAFKHLKDVLMNRSLQEVLRYQPKKSFPEYDSIIAKRYTIELQKKPFRVPPSTQIAASSTNPSAS
jgi:hypothetical protein